MLINQKKVLEMLLKSVRYSAIALGLCSLSGLSMAAEVGDMEESMSLLATAAPSALPVGREQIVHEQLEEKQQERVAAVAAIEYEVVLELGGSGTVGPVKIYNNLDLGALVSLGLGVSDGSCMKRSQHIDGKNADFFPKLHGGLTYTTVIRDKRAAGKTAELKANWFAERWVSKVTSDQSDKFFGEEPYMFIAVGTIPAIDFSGR
jgi:hypothetical protein